MKRLLKELANLQKEPLDYIYIDYKEDNIGKIDVLMIGGRETPYSRMFLRFFLEFPLSDGGYPLQPPKVTFTGNYNKKIHPNLIVAYVCLSTLNTGDKHGWVPTISLSSLLISIYSLFTKEMIFNDNTHEHEKSVDFFPGVIHDTFYITCKLLKEEKNSEFKEIMTEYATSHKQWYIEKLQKLSVQYDGSPLPNYYEGIDKACFKNFIPVFENL